MKTKPKFFIILLFIFIVIVVFFINYIRYWLSGGSDISFSTPDAFYFAFENNSGNNELYTLHECDCEECWYDKENNTFHLIVSDNFLNNNDISVYVSGSYWNYPWTPVIKVNGKIVDNVSTENDGKTNTNIYFNKEYHFYIYDTIIADYNYEFYVRCGNYSKEINIMFHAEE